MNIGQISTIIIPLLVFTIVIYGFVKKTDVYTSFLTGAKEGLGTVFSIFPSILAMIFAVNIFLKSNVLQAVLEGLNPVFNVIKFPPSVAPLALLRPVSGNAALAILNDIFTNFGPDSFAGRLGSTIQGCTDTTIYILALYFGSVKITKTRHALSAGLVADIFGVIASVILVRLILL